MSFRERNNAASKKSHEKSMEQLYATAYEHAMVVKHAADHPTSQVAHWSHVPEEWLEEAGYITSYNEHRLKRLMAKQEPADGVNRLKDYGADAMARSSDGTYDLLQAKYYKSNRVTAGDIGSFTISFLSLQLSHPTSKGHLYTSSRLQVDLAGFMAHPQYPIRHVLFPWAPPDKRLEPKKQVVIQDATLPLRDYQESAIQTLHEQDGMNALHIPCRMGKTIIAGHVIRSRQPRILVVMAPLKISVQNLRDTHRLASFLPAYKSLLVDSDVEGTTDRNEIIAFLHTEGPHVIYTTYESALTVVATIPGIEEAYLLVDEVHNVTPADCEFINRFSQGLVMSATLPEELEEELSLNTIVRVPFAQGIRDGYLTDYSIWLPFLTRNQEGETSVAVDIPVVFQHDDQTLIAQAMYLATVMLKTGARRCIVYLTSQEDCDRFMEHASKVFEMYHGIAIWTNKIDSTVTAAERTKRLQDFQSDLDVPFYLLTSVRILDEAVDIPKCDSVFVTSVGERSSDIRMMQRAMRGSTVDPSNPSKHNQVILWANGWEKCIQSLELIREADPAFHKKIRVAATYDRQGTTRDARETVEQQERETREYMVASCISPWEKQKMRWMAVYEKLGRCPSHGSKDLEEKRAARWQGTQRQHYKKGTLSQERINELDGLDGWIWDTWYEQKLHWITQYNRIQKSPSQIAKDQDEKRAGQWQSNQRQHYTQGTLSQERISELESIDGWKWDESTWSENKINWMTQYLRFQGNFSKRSHDIEEKRAGIWQCRQRVLYKKGELSQERIDELNATDGWQWDSDTWPEQKLHWITQYTRLGRCPSHSSKDKEEMRAATWQDNQRKQYKKRTISQEHIDELEATPGWIWSRDSWSENIKNWIAQYTRLGKGPSDHSNNIDEKKVGQWQTDQRKHYRHGTLSQARIDDLEAIDGWEWEAGDTWSKQKENWIAQYNLLEKSSSKRSKDPKEKRAGAWQAQQRHLYRQGGMPQEHVDELEGLDGWTWESYDPWSDNIDHWIAQYKRLQRGPSTTSKDTEEKRSAKWQSHQRENYRKGRLSQERINDLEVLDGWNWGEETYTWDEQKDHWIAQYTILQKSPSTTSKDTEEKRSAKWQSHQRNYYKKGTLSQEHIDELNATEGWTWSAK